MFNDVASTTEGHLMPPHVKLFVRDYVDGGRVPLTNRDAKSRFTISASQHRFLYHPVYRNASTHPVLPAVHCTHTPSPPPPHWIETEGLMM